MKFTFSILFYFAFIGCTSPKPSPKPAEEVTSASWSVLTNQDKMTDKVTKSAAILNESGESLVVTRMQGDRSVWLMFLIGKQSLNQISDDTAPIFRIDKYPAHDLSSDKSLTALMDKPGMHSLPLYIWKPDMVSVRIWHGDENQGIGSEMNEFLTGSSLTYRYYTSSGSSVEKTFTLNGARKALIESLDLHISPDMSAPKP